MSQDKTFAEIMAEAKAEATPAQVVRPGCFNARGELFDPSGELLSRTQKTITPAQARDWVARGAQLAFEGCGCGGWTGCQPIWVDSASREALAASKPRFVKGHGSPTWIDLWTAEDTAVVFAHGDVEWGEALV